MARHQDRMHAIKFWRGDTLAPYSPDSNPYDFLFWVQWKRKCINLTLETWLLWRGQLGFEFCKIPEEMVQKSNMKMKKRGDLRVGVSPFKHLMASILSWKMVSSHFITILAWCGLTPSCCHTVHLSLVSPRACFMAGKALSSNSCL
jgi:hypothetical protein